MTSFLTGLYVGAFVGLLFGCFWAGRRRERLDEIELCQAMPVTRQAWEAVN